MKNKLRYLFTVLMLMTLSACGQNTFSALEQQQISIADPTLFEQYDAFTVDFGLMEQDYCFPLPVGTATMGSDYIVNISTRKGDAVKAMFPGRVRLSRRHHETFGNVIVIRHPNGIETVSTKASADGRLYDLSGRPVKHPKPGLYIRNGRKVVVK